MQDLILQHDLWRIPVSNDYVGVSAAEVQLCYSFCVNSLNARLPLSCQHVETSLLICGANQFLYDGFYMMVTLAFNELMEHETGSQSKRS